MTPSFDNGQLARQAMLEIAAIVEATEARFGQPLSATLLPIENGGSGRLFYRTRIGPSPLVIAHYDLDREDNRHFVAIAHFLQEQGVLAARVLAHDESLRIIWMEDLGETDLWSVRNASWEEKRRAYQRALTTISQLHRIPLAAAEESGVLLQRPFDGSLYRWEQQYFFDHCLRLHFDCRGERVDSLAALSIWETMAGQLAGLPRVPIHRDFQSQNILLRSDAAWLIDFQGLRAGLPAYDIASLLADPYADLPFDQQADLLEDYLAIAEFSGSEQEQFRISYPLCAIQRLLQALGAYGNLGHRLGKTRYLAYIPVALRQLLPRLRAVPALDPLTVVLEKLESVNLEIGCT